MSREIHHSPGGTGAVSLTAAWILSRWSCWGIPCDKYGCPQVHRYTEAGATPDGSQSHLRNGTDVFILYTGMYLSFCLN